MAESMKRHKRITTEKAIKLLARDGVIYWHEDTYYPVSDWSGQYYTPNDGVDWLMVAIFFNTNEIHSFGQGMKTRIYL